MITLIPVSAVKLGIDIEGYEKLAQNIERMKSLDRGQRQEILEKAQRDLPNIDDEVRTLLNYLYHDREVYKIANLPYWKGPPAEKERFFITGVADYLLRNKEIISSLSQS